MAAMMVTLMIMGMVVAMILGVPVPMVMCVAVSRMLVSAALRLEPRLHMPHRPAETADHVLNNRIGHDADAVGKDFGRHVPIAYVPCDAAEMVRVRRRDLRHRFLRSDDPDDASVLQ